MSDPVWYRSLYWKIALGFIAMLAVLLLTQVLLFLWLTDRIFAAAPRTPAQLAAMVAEDVGTEIQQRTDFGLNTFVRDRFSHIYQPFLVLLTNGQRPSNRPDGLPPEFGRSAQGRLRGDLSGGGRFGEPPPMPRGSIGPAGSETGRDAPPAPRGSTDSPSAP